MNLNIENKVALVTGGVQGIGSSITRNLLDEGARVIATSRSQEAIDKFINELDIKYVKRDEGYCLRQHPD